jgi:DNA-binding transcriptional ArsR family regulator
VAETVPADKNAQKAIARAIADRLKAAPEPKLTQRYATAGEINRRVSEIARAVDLSLRVPGVHSSGLEYDHLLAILAAGGRDFAADTSALRRHVIATVQLELESSQRMPAVATIHAAIARATLEWIVKRFAGKVRDEPLRRLTLDYARAKRAAGYGGRPIGVRTANLALRVAEFGEVKVKAPR